MTDRPRIPKAPVGATCHDCGAALSQGTQHHRGATLGPWDELWRCRECCGVERDKQLAALASDGRMQRGSVRRPGLLADADRPVRFQPAVDWTPSAVVDAAGAGGDWARREGLGEDQ